MPSIGSMQDISSKWSRRAGSAQQEFQEGVEQTDKSWSEETQAAEDAYVSGVTEAAQSGRYGRAVAAAGDSKWRDKTLSLGPRRYAEGVGQAQDEYESGFAPYRERIASTNLPARGPRGDISTNIERVRAMAEALHNERVNR